jgi:hypothetical protein
MYVYVLEIFSEIITGSLDNKHLTQSLTEHRQDGVLEVTTVVVREQHLIMRKPQ